MTEKIEKTEPTKLNVFEAICRVQQALAEVGIKKNHRNDSQGAGYSFRGIDDVYNTLAPLLAKNSLVVIPRVMTRTVSQYTTRNGAFMFNVAVTVRYAIVSAIDGSRTFAIAPGEASDSGDKATNKAMSAAYKYMMFQLFCIPIDVLDADASTPPEAVNPNYQPPQKPQGSQQNNQGSNQQKSQQKPQGNNQSNNQGNNQKPQSQQGQKPQGNQQGSQQKKEAKKSERTQPFSEQELVIIENEISVAASDSNGEKLHELGGMLGVERAWIQPQEKLKALVVKCLGSRSSIVTKKTLQGFEEMVKRFTTVGVLTQTEALSLRNNSRSILNEQLITQ